MTETSHSSFKSWPSLNGIAPCYNANADLAKTTAKDAISAAKSAERAAKFADQLSIEASSSARAGPADGDDTTVANGTLEALAREYNETRATMRPGPQRTSAMTGIVSKMISACSGVPSDEANLIDDLNSDDQALRLVGYANLYANPDPQYVQELSDALIDETLPFNQYWAIGALRKQIALDPQALQPDTERRLETLMDSLDGTDRGYELRAALGDVSMSKLDEGI